MSERQHFLGIEAGRGIAALMVVVHHAGAICHEHRFFGINAFGAHYGNFNAGVDFFFVLSGFIITWIHADDIGKSGRIRRFVEKRFLRIYPAYWGIVVPLILLYLAFPQGGGPEKRDPLDILLSLLLLPATMKPVLGVAWTLSYELFFYLLFALIMRSGRHMLWLLPIWTLAILVGHAFSPLPFPLSFLLNAYNLEFIMGVGAAMMLRHNRNIPFSATMMVGGAGAFLTLVLFARTIQNDPLVGRLVLGACATLFVVGVVGLERRRAIFVPPPLLWLGAASYAIYLIHAPLLLLAIQILKRSQGLSHLSVNMGAVIIIIFAILGGMIYHVTVERWLTAIARRVLARGEGPLMTATPGGSAK